MNDPATASSAGQLDRGTAYRLAMGCGVFNSIAAVMLVLVIIRHSFFVSEHSGGLEEILIYLMVCTPVFLIGLGAAFASKFARGTCALLNLSFLLGLLVTTVIDEVDDTFRKPAEDPKVSVERWKQQKQQTNLNSKP